jgi:hypothetical protein
VRRVPRQDRRADQFACVDGPDFDGHQVDFDDLMARLGRYKPTEKAPSTLEGRAVASALARILSHRRRRAR